MMVFFSRSLIINDEDEDEVEGVVVVKAEIQEEEEDRTRLSKKNNIYLNCHDLSEVYYFFSVKMTTKVDTQNLTIRFLCQFIQKAGGSQPSPLP